MMREDKAGLDKTFGIGRLARLAGCSVDAIRFYERAGLMPKPRRSEGGQRRYGAQDAGRLLLIRRLRNLGFGLEEIAELLHTLRRKPYSCSDFGRAADARAAEIHEKIDELRRLERLLREISAACATARLDNCALFTAAAAEAPGSSAAVPVCCAGPKSPT